MSIETILKNASNHSRNLFNLKSENKLYLRPERLPEPKRQFYSLENWHMKKELFSRTLNEIPITSNPYERNSILLRVQGNNNVGNCDQFSYMALEYLVENSKFIFELYKKPFNISLVSVCSNSNDFGHIFVVLSNNYQHQLNELFKQHENSEVWICDPWANIVCRSHKYPFEWKIKMLKWHAQEKYLFTQKGITSPTKPQVYQLMELNNSHINVSYSEFIDFTHYPIR
ncbi:hypothetical protein [Xenorhabdus sp. IM139775]|uniref:hypothetical protein n=1 Tax=Xenorhabdus sp. IM139775 TaxID=3025876 RepID=UPI002358DFD4|nr:hypothetical protein [Xenorhabdus sp. IM139775]MDC9592512.1 hypothetical protein [Xenorhabdus sp. IM139775]